MDEILATLYADGNWWGQKLYKSTADSNISGLSDSISWSARDAHKNLEGLQFTGNWANSVFVTIYKP